MAIHVEIEKSFKGFSLKTAFDSKSSAIGILGASGSGKSMTLRCIAGIEKPDKGKIIINGRTVFDSEKNDQSQTTGEKDRLPFCRTMPFSRP